jgi:hypothetical protein
VVHLGDLSFCFVEAPRYPVRPAQSCLTRVLESSSQGAYKTVFRLSKKRPLAACRIASDNGAQPSPPWGARGAVGRRIR